MPARPRANRTPDGAKKRWTADDRARRTGASAAPSRGAAGGNRADRRGDRFGQQDRPAEERGDRRPDWYPGGRTEEGEARGQRRADRGDRRPDARSGGSDRPPGDAERSGRRPFRDDRAERRPFRDERGERRPFREGRDDRAERRPFRDDRGEGRDDRGERRPFRDDRGERRDDRRTSAGSDRRPSSDSRGERPARRPDGVDRRPSSFRGDARTDRPFRPRDDRPARPDRRSGTDHRPHRDDRTAPRRHETADAPRWEAPEDVVLERLQGEVVTAEEVSGSSFADLGLGPRITDALAELGATEPFPIQAATVPPAVAGRNVLGRGRTGSGKTIAFGAALVERLMRNWAESGRSGTGRKQGRPPRALILAPTRELALQIDRTVQPLARAVGLYTTQIVGGVPQGRQVGALAKGVDIVIGTPGRIEDLLEQGRLDLGSIEIAVLDEADHMAELGFLEPIQRLLRRIPEGGQRLMFSATLDTAVSQLVDEFLPDPDVHEVADPEGTGSADHRVLVIEPGSKLPVLTALIDDAERVLVFARTRAFAEQLADELDDAGVKAESLHGDLNQARRTRNLQRFAEGRVAALVATDVAARGIHVDGIDLVIHADAAEDYKTYLHRSGRTGRAGASGTVVTLINPRRRRRMTELLDRAGVEAAFVTLREGDDPVAAVRS